MTVLKVTFTIETLSAETFAPSAVASITAFLLLSSKSEGLFKLPIVSVALNSTMIGAKLGAKEGATLGNTVGTDVVGAAVVGSRVIVGDVVDGLVVG